MSQTDFFSESSTILRTPVWYDGATRDDHPLPLSPDDYKVFPDTAGGHWTVTDLKTGVTVYNGIGPVEIVRSRPGA